jgi:hypothetical protein
MVGSVEHLAKTITGRLVLVNHAKSANVIVPLITGRPDSRIADSMARGSVPSISVGSVFFLETLKWFQTIRQHTAPQS